MPGCLTLQTKILLLIIFLIGVIALCSCAHLPCGSPEQVQKWMDKKKFRAERKIKNHNADSCTIARMLAMKRGY